MAADLTPITIYVGSVGYNGPGTTGRARGTNLASTAIAQVEAPGLEMARTGRSYVGGLQLITSGRIPVVDLPTTTGPVCLFNGAASSNAPAKHLVVKRLAFAYASGTLGAYGSTLFAGVTPSVLATALVANGTNFSIQATRGTGSSVAYMAQGQTIPAGTAWALLGGIAHGAETTMSIGYSVDLDKHPFIVPPGFALAFGVLADTGTTAKYIHSAAWDEVEMTLP